MWTVPLTNRLFSATCYAADSDLNRAWTVKCHCELRGESVIEFSGGEGCRQTAASPANKVFSCLVPVVRHHPVTVCPHCLVRLHRNAWRVLIMLLCFKRFVFSFPR